MLSIQKNVQLKPYNTFGVEALAKHFVIIDNLSQWEELCETSVYKNEQRYIIGGGSNILWTKDFDGLIIKANMKGKKITYEDENTLCLNVGAGEIWHYVVRHCLRQNWGGIENLSLIPGTCGAAPVQNIGAYGVEIKDVVKSVQAVKIASNETVVFDNAACLFGYRDSIFKQSPQQYFVTNVTLCLTKKNHQCKTSYGSLQHELFRRSIKHPTIQDIGEAVTHIRETKLPDPKFLGNAGSFFKNPTVDEKKINQLRQAYPAVVFYPIEDGQYKISAGWLIEQEGWKGKRIGNVGIHATQALALINYGNATGREILDVAMEIKNSVKQKFSIELSPEANIL